MNNNDHLAETEKSVYGNGLNTGDYKHIHTLIEYYLLVK